MFFIAEISSNHSQDIHRCLKLVEAAKESGFDAIKFQAFKIEELYAPEILNQSEEHMARKDWTFPIEFLPEIKQKCDEVGISLGITPFYLQAVNDCNDYVDFFKIASYELLWKELLIECCASNKPMIISTGMANIDEVKASVELIEKHNCNNLTILHCVSSYPVTDEEVNLGAISHMQDVFDWPIGWSDHSRNPNVVVSSVLKWGASTVEMHLDLDGSGEEYGPGHCWLPSDASEVIKICRESVKFNGVGMKQPAKSEITEREWRADPVDGLRPFISIRKDYKP